MPAPAKVKVRAAVVIGALAVMALVPIAALDDPRPSMFGWHMYAGQLEDPNVDVVYSDGREESFPLRKVAPHLRPEVDYSTTAARFLCERDDAVASVRVWRESPAIDKESQCSAF